MVHHMSFEFTSEHVSSIGKMLSIEPEIQGDDTTIALSNEESRQTLTLTLHNNVQFSEHENGSLVVAHTQHGYFELHGCSGFMLFEPDEVIFYSQRAERMSFLVVGKQCTCSMFSDIVRENLSADFADIDPRLIMSSMQLSLTETVVDAP